MIFPEDLGSDQVNSVNSIESVKSHEICFNFLYKVIVYSNTLFTFLYR